MMTKLQSNTIITAGALSLAGRSMSPIATQQTLFYASAHLTLYLPILLRTIQPLLYMTVLFMRGTSIF